MLEPREADIPDLFLVLGVLPLVAYILLGKWSESAKKRERISLLAQLAAEEAFRAEVMATACIIPPMSTSKNGIHFCARCFSPATTRCSRCKSVRYCSGKCQIIHWRQVHKEECQRLETTSSCSSPMAASCDESIPEKLSINDGLDLFSLGYNSKQPAMDTGLSDNNVHPLTRTGACAAEVGRMGNANPAAGTNGVTSIGIMKMVDLRKSSKLATQDITGVNATHTKLRMLFPYEEFVNLFNSEVIDLTPRGLVNCGNSCYANAVLQCLTCTKPLIVFLLRRSHSRACCEIDWCLMCELEQHVMMIRECGGPLSPSRILLHMRKINHQIGNGSQEDAHEFLRLLIASMQSICLEKLGGEDRVDPRLQETTFIQHTFGGRLRSKVKCLRCHHESERYENIMDLTLEIFGWVESLEDALTQFTTPEELDGENMYRCGRCAAYVRARKQLSIHEAPNVLTIVLKRFQEGKYGKINKCVTFPDMLDMIPFMTGTGDVPPLYMLYAVVVHLDTLNASFSGHYVAYVKDLQGSWFRIDDTEVHPVSMSQVMLEGAYILFYTRSCPRPEKAICEKASRQQVPLSLRHCMSRTQKPSRQGQSKCSSHFVGPEASLDVKPENCSSLASYANGIPRRSAKKNPSQVMDFSDATSSDRSLFTSSDEASFTTESTRDSFSTIDYADACNADAFSSIFNDLYAPESSYQNTLCR
ncbi:PREDICTED: ubiquitin carboxyl-terminal hydrolase 15-like isoform X4 [Populus euphratica]|uniref:ubiquitinyl hydrolase 1 n=1 Tax=Populus euphratica TaxID=75702 RepID=A0AAJ6VBQ9_POPEU|nr:PREDICTED: ubiquitin carboxyl-terminal hydrolase 15-like isoform X4 [Populus euphratica]